MHLLSKKIDEIVISQESDISFKNIYVDDKIDILENQFVFFIKPELLVKTQRINLGKVLEQIDLSIEKFGFNIHAINILSGSYLKKYDIISQHYGIINKISRNAILNMPENSKDKFEELFSKSIKDEKVLGGFEFLDKFPDFNATSLEILWQNLENIKLGGGTYVEPVKVDSELIYLINGFHPRQLNHFTQGGRNIVVMNLSSNISWKEARQNFIGSTDPRVANKNSLRRDLLDKKDFFGLEDVSQGVNGIHLSAGPIEALIELVRYNSNFDDDSKKLSISDFKFGKELFDNFGADTDKILNNVNLEINNKLISVFDLTEETNSIEAIEILKKYF